MKDERNDSITAIFNKFKIALKEIEFLKTFLVPVHPAGYPIIILFIIVSLILGAFSDLLGWIGIVLSIWCVYFFRDPVRVVPKNDNMLISPADGLVLPVSQVVPPIESGIKVKMKKVSIFMNVFNVHVNRIPFKGKIIKLSYEPGAFFNASLDKASIDNERMTVRIELEKGVEIVVVQIAGLIARRIKCDLSENQNVETGEKFGIIRFGSRVDVYMPLSFNVNVLKGQTAIGGETVIANIKKPSSKTKLSKDNVLEK